MQCRPLYGGINRTWYWKVSFRGGRGTNTVLIFVYRSCWMLAWRSVWVCVWCCASKKAVLCRIFLVLRLVALKSARNQYPMFDLGFSLFCGWNDLLRHCTLIPHSLNNARRSHTHWSDGPIWKFSKTLRAPPYTFKWYIASTLTTLPSSTQRYGIHLSFTPFRSC